MSILPEKLERYRKFFSFIIKYWNSELLEYSERKVFGDDDGAYALTYEQSPEEFANDLKEMGPTYIKFGQLLSTRPDLLPDDYLKALCKLQDEVEPISFEEVQELFESEVGVKISKAFDSFDEKPLASASIGQVHKAVLHSGRIVAVKFQRPGVRKRFLSDLDTLCEMAEWAQKHSEDARKYNVADVVDELRYTLLQELDYAKEANNLLALKSNMREFKHIHVPEPILDYSTSRVLTMEFIEGRKVTRISPLRRIEENMDEVVDDLVKGYLKQVISDGFAHADPHPGNIHLMADNRLALMDLGMIARFTAPMQEQILRLMIALSNYESEKVAEILLELSKYNADDANITVFQKNIGRLILDTKNKTASDMQTGRLIIQMNRVAAANNIRIPAELNMLAKILLNMDQLIAVLSPDYDANKTIRQYVQRLMEKKMLDELKPGNVFGLALESKKLAEKTPERLNKILEKLANNELQLKIDAIDERRFTDAFQKVANRITLGIIIAAMIVGAALLIQIPTSWTILGYPGLAILFFLIAALLGFYLVYAIIVKDENLKRPDK